MSEQKDKAGPSSKIIFWAIIIFVIGFFVAIAIPNYNTDGRGSPAWKANGCINNLREIDAAKDQWTLEHDAKSHDVVTLNDIRPYIEREVNNPFIKLDTKGNLPRCPSGGTYKIGKIGEPPTCSLGANVTPAHVLP